MRLRSRPTINAIAKPIATPPRTERMNPPPISHMETDPATAAMAVRSITIAVASLTRLSPSRMLTTRRGKPYAARDRRGGDGIGWRDNGSEGQRRRKGDGQHRPHEESDAECGEDHQSDAQQHDRALVFAEIDQRRANRSRVEQRWEQTNQDEFGSQLIVGANGT